MRSGLIRLLETEARGDSRKILVLAVMEGLSNALIIVILNSAADHFGKDHSNFRYLILFLICMTIFLYCKKYVGTRVAEISQQAIHSIRLRVADKIRRSKLAVFEEIDRSRFTTALTDEAERVAKGAIELSKAVPAAVMLAGSFTYIGILSGTAFLLCLGGMVIVVWVAASGDKRNSGFIQRSMTLESDFFKLLDHLLDGFKEVKINRRRSDDLYDDMRQTGDEALGVRLEVEENNVKSAVAVYFAFFLILGANVFILPRIRPLPAEEIVNIVTVLVFIVGNIGILGEGVPHVSRAEHALAAIDELEKLLDEGADLNGEVSVAEGEDRTLSFGKLELRQVMFRYPTEGDAPGFMVGPIELEIDAGEMVFITGGNGSGKSTLLRLLAGLYSPDGGRVLLDGKPIRAEHIVGYRDLFTIIPTDFHLFDRLYGIRPGEIQQKEVDELLVRLEIDAKTSVVDGRFTNTRLSTGQRKRLALLTSYIERSPICIFDEVAADQDPTFRRFLYREFFQDFVRRGKTLIAVTHDDAYFDVATQRLHMDYGKLERL